MNYTLAYLATRNFLHFSFKNNPGKKIFYGILAFSTHLLSFALAYLFSERWAKADALPDLCHRFSTLTSQSISYLPNFWNLSFGGPWPIENPLQIIQQAQPFQDFSEIPVSVLQGAAAATTVIIAVSLWRAKVRDAIDRELDENLISDFTEETDTLHKKNL
jgi:hypothetical protein